MTDRRRPRTVLVEDQERPLAWVGPDPDPLNPADVDSAYGQGYVDGVAHSIALEAARRRRRDHLGIVAVLAAAAALFIVGYAAGRASAAPRSALTTTPLPGASEAIGSVDVPAQASASASSGPTGVPPAEATARTRAVEPATTSDLAQQAGGGAPSPTARAGIASFVSPSYGGRYLALPAGPGHRVRICSSTSPDRCVVRTSTDAGPDLAQQRAGRIADLSFADFAWLCGCDPWRRGLLRVTVAELGPDLTPPPTDRG